MPRFTIDLGEKFDSVLKDLSSSQETTKSEIIRRSVGLYAFLQRELKEQATEKKLSITSLDDKVLKDIVLP